MDSNKKQKTSQDSKPKASKPSKGKASVTKSESNRKESVGPEPENLSQNFEQDGQDEDSRPRAFSQKSGTDQQEGSERMEEEKSMDSKDDEDEVNSVESLEQNKNHFDFNKPKSWEFQPVKIANVWDFEEDLIVYKWVKVRESGPALPKREREKIKVYKCRHDDCGKVFNDPSNMKKHMLTHGERMFICSFEGCGKKFLDNSKLKRHFLVHSGEKKFKCDICGKLFSLDFNLRTHMRTHTGEKPYFCRFPGCSKRFTQSSNLSAHEKVHMMKEGPVKGKLSENDIEVEKVEGEIKETKETQETKETKS